MRVAAGFALVALIVCVAGCSDDSSSVATPTPIPNATSAPCTPTATPTPSSATGTVTPTQTCTPPPPLAPTFRFTVEPDHPLVGDSVRVHVDDDLGYVNLRTQWFVSGGEPVLSVLGVSSSEFGVDVRLEAVAAGTGYLLLIGYYQYDFVCYPGSAAGRVQSDWFAITVMEASTPTPPTAAETPPPPTATPTSTATPCACTPTATPGGALRESKPG